MCIKCDDTGWVKVEENCVSSRSKCVCEREKWAESYVPPRYRKARLVQFGEVIQASVAFWIKSTGDGLLITGPVGSGKTHLAAAIAIEMALKGKGVKFSSVAEMYRSVRSAMHENMDMAVIQDLVDVEFLVLDDAAWGD